MEISLLLTLTLREQASLQSTLVTRGAPDALVTLAVTGACRIQSLQEARTLYDWLVQAQAQFKGNDAATLQIITDALTHFGINERRMRARRRRDERAAED